MWGDIQNLGTNSIHSARKGEPGKQSDAHPMFENLQHCLCLPITFGKRCKVLNEGLKEAKWPANLLQTAQKQPLISASERGTQAGQPQNQQSLMKSTHHMADATFTHLDNGTLWISSPSLHIGLKEKWFSSTPVTSLSWSWRLLQWHHPCSEPARESSCTLGTSAVAVTASGFLKGWNEYC